MNAPVVAIEDLPVGPARAAVALSQGADGTVNATVAVRCARTRRVAFFTAGGELLELRSTSIAMEAALSFAESMGFLFDDEEVEIRGTDGPRLAAKIWKRFMQGDADETDLPNGPERGEILAEVELDDELGPILSSVAHDLNEAASREFDRVAPGLDSLAEPDSDRDASLVAGLDGEPPSRPEEVPFWLAIPGEDIPQQCARVPTPEVASFNPPEDRIDGFASREEVSSPGTDDTSALEARRELDPGNRELLMNVLAETSVDRLCGAPHPPGPGLSKFRLKPSESGVRCESRPGIRTRDERGPDAAEVRGTRDETHRDEVNPPRAARYHESTRRPHLLLRLLSRF